MGVHLKSMMTTTVTIEELYSLTEFLNKNPKFRNICKVKRRMEFLNLQAADPPPAPPTVIILCVLFALPEGSLDIIEVLERLLEFTDGDVSGREHEFDKLLNINDAITIQITLREQSHGLLVADLLARGREELFEFIPVQLAVTVRIKLSEGGFDLSSAGE